MLSLDEITELHKNRHANKARLITFYRNLSSEEAQWLAKQAIRLLLVNRKLAEAIIEELASFIPQSLTELHPFLMQHDIVFPRHIFKYASPTLSKQLIEEIENELNNNLCLLAWIGDKQVEEYFAHLRKNTPEWRSKLYVPPEDYAHEAGWTLDEQDKRHDLFYQSAFRLVKNVDNSQLPVCPFEILEERCVQCGNKLAILFDFDLTRRELAFMDLSGTRLRIKTCLDCSCYTTMATGVDFNGKSEMRSDNQPNKYGIKIKVHDDYDGTLDRVYLGEQRRTPYEALSTLIDFQSQVGGHPFWWQNARYPKCRVCQKPMPFIAQVQVGSGGFYYAHLCKDCGVASVHYQNS